MPDTPKPDLEELLDTAATALAKVLNRIADRAQGPKPEPPRPLCKRPDCRRYHNANLWLMVITQAGQRRNIRVDLCDTHAMEAHKAHQAGNLSDYGNAIILKTHITRWQGQSK